MNLFPRISLLTVTLALAWLPADIRAQESSSDAPRTGYGIYGDFNLNRHFADFRAIPGVPNCCPRFERGSGTGFSVGLLYEMPIGSALLLDLRAGYSGNNGLLKRTETTSVDRGGEVVAGEFEHTVEAKLPTIGLEPLLGYRILGGLAAHLGGHVAYVLAPAYAQREVIVQPGIGTFAGTKSRVRNEFSGELPGASSISAGLLGGLSYELPMESEGIWRLAPELLYTVGLTPVVKGIEWSVGGVRAGIAIKYTPLPAAPGVRPPAPPPPPAAVDVPPAKPALAASVSAAGVAENGVEVPEVTVRVEEFLSTRLKPLLNYVFFDEGSASLPVRYRNLSSEEAGAFLVEKLHNEETLPTYYHLLNIIGRRMVENRSAAITIVGCNGDEGKERGDGDLSRRRALAVRDYLRDVWKIAEGRMKLEARNLPAKPSNVAEIDGRVENRRAEIYSDTWEIIAPVFTHDTIRSASPPTIRFRPQARAEAGVAGWKLTVMQGGRPLREFTGEGSPPPRIDWRLGDGAETMPREGDSIAYLFEVKDNASGSVTATSASIPVEELTIQRKRRERIADREIDRFSLILFDFDKTDLNDANRRIIRLIAGYLKPTSVMEITGHTDRMGEADYNRHLSESRAAMTARGLGRTGASVAGVGEQRPLYENDLPEGRFYNRTVDIVVETPVEEPR